MLISVEMQTGVYYKLWQHIKEVFQIWLQSESTAKTERKNHRKQHENVYVDRAPYWTWIRSTVRDTLNVKHRGPSSACYIVQYKYDASSHGNTHLVYGEKGNFL